MVVGQQLATALGAEMVALNRAGHNDVLSNPHWDTFVGAVVRVLKGIF